MRRPPAQAQPTRPPVHLYLSAETGSSGEREARQREGDQDSVYTHLLQTLYSLPTILPHAHPTPPTSPSSPRSGIRCLPLKSRMGSNRTQAFDRAAPLPQGPLMEELGQNGVSEARGTLQLGAVQWDRWCVLRVSGVYLRANRLIGRLLPSLSLNFCGKAQLADTHLERIG